MGQEFMQILRGIARAIGLIIHEFVIAVVQGDRIRKTPLRRPAASRSIDRRLR